jgi:hypothetical protein
MISAFRSQDHRIQAEFEAPDNSNTVGVMSGYWRGQRACPASIGYLAEPILKEFAGATDLAAIQKILASLPSNHSPLFAPVIEPTLQTGVAALVRAAHTWLPVSVQ